MDFVMQTCRFASTTRLLSLVCVTRKRRVAILSDDALQAEVRAVVFRRYATRPIGRFPSRGGAFWRMVSPVWKGTARLSSSLSR